MKIPFPSCPGRIGRTADDKQDRASSLAIRLYCLFCLLLVISCSGKKSGSTAPIGSVSQATEQSKPPTTSPTSESAITVPALVDTQMNGANLTSTASDTIHDVGGTSTTSKISTTASIASTTNTTTQQLSDLNQLNFSPIPTIGGNQYCAANQYVSANQCKTRDYVDIAAGNASVTCALRGTGSTMHCVSNFTYALFSDPWQKAPYVPGTLNVGGNHVCAMSASDSTYYCWGYWGYKTDTTGFWDTFSCSTVPFKVEDEYSVQTTEGVTQTTLCKGSRKQKGKRFLSSGDTDCEIVDGTPICAGSKILLSTAETDSFLLLSAYTTLSLSHTCTVHQDASVTCNYNGVDYTPILPTLSTSNIKVSHTAVSSYWACAYITTINSIGCWSRGVDHYDGYITVLQNSRDNFSTLKSTGSMFCATDPQSQVRCWIPPNPNPLTLPLPATVSTYTVGNGYVCTLDITGTAGCWDETGKAVTSLQL